MNLAIKNRVTGEWTTYLDIPSADLEYLTEWNIYDDDTGDALEVNLYTWKNNPPEPVRIARATGELETEL